MRRNFLAILLLSCSLALSTCTSSKPLRSQRVVHSNDGVPISYEHYGEGEITLLFVHGWSCDSRYWQRQVPYFAKQYQVVVMDLAGHGHSGLGRKEYTMKSFGYDVKAIVDSISAKQVILVGHSMGGGVIAEAARLLPKRVVGLIGVDTSQDVTYVLKKEELQEMLYPFEVDFASGVKAFLEPMFVPGTDGQLRQWIVNDMSAAPKEVAIKAMKEYLGQYVTGEAARVFQTVKAPFYAVNTDIWPTAIESNRKHMSFFDLVIMRNVGHFLMLEKPKEFNKILDQVIGKIIKGSIN
jgi:pimeloyl-ACP methyl ester carboxylesterase